MSKRAAGLLVVVASLHVLLVCGSRDSVASSFKMRGVPEEAVQIPVARTWLQAKVSVQASPVVVIALHPWGPLGGSMDDPHPVTVTHLFGKAGCSTARLDFRSGIGSGESSVADVKAVAAWFVEPRDGKAALASQVIIVGYSYGSMIGAAAAAEIPQCVAWAALGPPLGYSWALYLWNAGSLRARAANSAGKPKLLMLGTSDEFCSERSFQGFVQELPEPKKAVVLDGVNHFSIHPHLPQALKDWVRQGFGVPDLETLAKEGLRQGACAAAEPS